MLLYNAYVLPILLYNCGTWGLNKADLTRVAAFHRKQLRSIAGIHFPRRISNDVLYELTGATKSGDDGHASANAAIRPCTTPGPQDAQAPMSMDLYFSAGQRRLGRPVSCLATSLEADMTRSRRSFKNTGDLKNLRLLASDRDAWKELAAEQLT